LGRAVKKGKWAECLAPAHSAHSSIFFISIFIFSIPNFNLNSNFKFKPCAEFVPELYCELKKCQFGKYINFLYILYTLFFLKSSSHYYFIFIHMIIVLNAQQKSNMMQLFICVLVKFYSFLNMVSHM
jgi:hypothetical protein